MRHCNRFLGDDCAALAILAHGEVIAGATCPNGHVVQVAARTMGVVWPAIAWRVMPGLALLSRRETTEMIRSELLAALAKENPGLRAEEVERVVDVFFDEIAQRLAAGGRVELRGFGAFSTREREPRKGRNPRTGESVEVPGKRVPYFKPGKEMRQRLNAD